jgi:DnaJ-class molecular chaperone
MDYYEALNISKEASQEEIKRAYQQLILRHHPDKAEGDLNIFLKIEKAYKVRLKILNG